MYRMCDVNYIDFWWYTPAETSAMLDIANEKLKFDTIKHAQILLWTANAPHAKRQDKKLWKLEDFLPDFVKDTIKETDIPPDKVFEMWWNAAED